MRYLMARTAGLAGIGLVVAACSSTSTSSPASSGPATSSSAASSPASAPASSASATGQAAAATVTLQTAKGIPGKFLVGSNGRTLYLFEADKGGTSACSGACAAAWPPDAVTGTPQAGSGISQALLGAIKRADGSMQLTYGGHPLYYFAGDTGAGTTQGQGSKAFGAGWYVVNAKGSKIDTS